MSEIRKVSTVADLGDELAASRRQDVWFFKHSLICGVSDAAKREFESFVDRSDPDAVRFCLVEIQPARPVSEALAERVAVRHQSPQAILVRGGEAVWHASHWEITRNNLAAAS